MIAEQIAGNNKAWVSHKPKARRIRFQLSGVEAKNVHVVGSFNGWRTFSEPMLEVTRGFWVKDLLLKPGTYEYLYLVDGAYFIDPMAEELAPNPYGGMNSILRIEESAED